MMVDDISTNEKQDRVEWLRGGRHTKGAQEE
jgi:hypothetical protein